MREIELYTADCRGNPYNTKYPKRWLIHDVEDLRAAATFDQVFAKYKDDQRAVANFLSSNCLPFDCDNDHSDIETAWKTPEEVMDCFPGVSFYVIYSRNHHKQKGSQSARPRFHVLFPIETVTNQKKYANLKEQVIRRFPYFDTNAKDSARFFFGVQTPKVEAFGNGSVTVDRFLETAASDQMGGQIPEGKRNTSLSRIAARLVKRYGPSEEAKDKFLSEASRCTPPLDQRELESVWKSAVKFGQKIAQQEGYIPPEEYNKRFLHKPSDYSDVGQALVFTNFAEEELRYSPATDYIVYNGTYWEESLPQTQGVYHKFTERQLKEAQEEVIRTTQWMVDNGAMDLIVMLSPKKALAEFSPEQRQAFNANKKAKEYEEFVIKRRDSRYVTATLKESTPILEIDPVLLDADPFLLNTPSFTIDLRKGINGKREHRPEDFITKCTLVDPGHEGRKMWEDALRVFFVNDSELIHYVKKIAGLALVGHVYMEALIIVYGVGKNGKSTFWNAILRVLDSYGGNLSADTLTVGCKRNVKPELAETRGKRLLIASELEEGMRLNTSTIKQLCSTDPIFAEKKYKAPFSFIPSHTTVLYTNHLPKVGANDPGTWRRLIVVPFKAVIERKQDVLNFTDELVEKAGSAILRWMIEGSEEVIRDKFHIEPPACVKEATEAYRENSDWLHRFIEECCEVAPSFIAPSGEFYSCYRFFSQSVGDYTRSTTDFYAAIEAEGFTRKRNKEGRFILGIRLKPEFQPLT